MNTKFTTHALRRAAQSVYRSHHAPSRFSQLSVPQQRMLHVTSASTYLRKPHHASIITNQIRWKSTQSEERPLTDREDATGDGGLSAEEIAQRKAQQPSYEMTFTCRKCLTRSSHRVTKQAYHFGTTLITCPGCKNRHLISDHLKIFSDTGITIEDILREKGELLRKGRLGEDGDIEFYDDPPAAKEPLSENEK